MCVCVGGLGNPTQQRRDTASGVYLPYYYYKSLLLIIKLRVLVRLHPMMRESKTRERERERERKRGVRLSTFRQFLIRVVVEPVVGGLGNPTQVLLL